MKGIKTLPFSGSAVELTLLDGGGLTTTDDTKIHADGHDKPYFLYNWCFYIHHRASGRKILWDLGISDDRQMYTPFVLNYHWTSCNPIGPRRRLADQLQDIGVKTSDIDTVLFRLRKAADEYGIHIAMAHDAEFVKDGSDAVLISWKAMKRRE
ncbi:hypothetical protein CNYM01_02921 [Colletotrichum nymphaeae SA-01]|uniref:Uncharacterized protein n=1 Tax=Colletotrichum nymphaeae SA-01 TaxID=1460502 RepID=A0A135S1T3_9PEZI|nr:hypothetical protein CNYM01_02921 [Colletotrichum nymphaeae SA-01]